jgi:hypothetical protein
VQSQAASLDILTLNSVDTDYTLQDSLLCFVECNLEADFIAPVNSVCEGDFLQFENISSNAASNDWYVDGEMISSETDFSFLFQEAGIHLIELRIFDGPCEDNASMTIEVHVNPSVQIITPSMLLCSDDSPVQLESDPLGGSFDGLGVVNDFFDPIISGIGQHWIYYSYTDANGCYGVDSLLMEVDICDGLREEKLISLVVWPNPNDGLFTIISSLNIEDLQIFDLTGRVVFQSSEMIRAGEQINVDLSALENGPYIGSWSSELGVGRKRIVIQR